MYGRTMEMARPWRQARFAYPNVPTMISEEERRYLYWLSSSIWTGEGHIVEMGPWLGGSTVCLAAGMRKNQSSTSRKLHVFDNFIWREFMSRRAALPLKQEDSFRSYFEENTKPYEDLLVTHEKSLPDEEMLSDNHAQGTRDVAPDQSSLVRWDSEEPVEVLFIDGAKSWSGLRFLLAEFSDHLIPGKTLLVCQDYKYWGAYWVSMMMEMLQGHLELVHNLPFNTVAFRLISPLHEEVIRSLGSFETIDVDTGLAYLDKASNRLSDRGDKLGGAILQACKIRFLGNKGNLPKALETYRSLEAGWPISENDSNLERARQWLARQRGAAVNISIRRRTGRLLFLIMNMLRRGKKKFIRSLQGTFGNK